MLPAPLLWKPTSFQEFIENFGTSTGAAHVTTDAGPAYLKAMGNPIGPHTLASEWVGTQLARLFKLQTFDAALLVIDSTTDEIPFPKGGFAQSGPAFCTRAEAGRPWSGSTQDLDKLDNLQDVTRFPEFKRFLRRDVLLICLRTYPSRPGIENTRQESASVFQTRIRAYRDRL